MPARKRHLRLPRSSANPPTLRTGKDAGLSLIEMVVAVGITMVVVLAMGAALVGAQQSQRVAEATDRATQIANDQIEKARQRPWSTLGFYTNTYDTTGTYNGVTYQTAFKPCATCPTESPVIFSGNDPVTNTANQLRPVVAENATLKNKFTVHTYITLAQGGSVGTPASTGSTNSYTYKRVRVVVSWKVGSRIRDVTIETLIAPTTADEVPPYVPVT